MLSYHDQVKMSSRELVKYKLELMRTLARVNSELKFREMCGDDAYLNECATA